MSRVSIYKKFLKQRHLQSYRFFNVLWGVVGSIGLYIFTIFEPWSLMFFEFLIEGGVSEMVVFVTVIPLLMLLKALILVEAVGYFYHRFFEHLGFLTKLSNQIRKNQKNHWKHHMIDYSIGPGYIKDEKYKKSQPGIAWKWAFPGFLTLGLIIVFQGITIANIVFFAFIILYAIMVGKTHERFHEIKNPWSKSKYFNWLEDIHKIHCWDQSINYTITFPLFDIIFGTYVSPKKHPEALKEANQKHKLYTSDLINWHYMMHFAWPKKLAIQVSDIKRNKDQKAKFKLILADLKKEFKKDHEDVLLNAYLNRMESLDSSIN